MKVSLSWLKELGAQGIDVPIDELVERIGAQLGAVEAVENLGEKYQGIVIAKVMKCVDHPDADRLHVCTIDDGGNTQGVNRDAEGYAQVVCGASNVREGLMVAWLPPGSTVPDSVGREPFVLEARELRGVVSNGMLASPKELALSEEHDGILEIDPTEWSPNQAEIKPGADFAKVFGLDTHVIDIENKMFTHRPDCFGQLGVAREVAGISGQQFTSPAWYTDKPEFPSGEGLPLEVVNEAPEVVPRLMTLAMKNVTVKPSPLWLQCALVSIGAKPINNIVDVTNYIMLLTAQPTHAYDYDKLRGHKLVARMAKPSEKITLLNHKSYELDPTDIVIADGEGPIGLGGVMGGGDSEVSADTTNIVLECANFDMYTVRRSSMRHGVFTDALTRFNKGQSPLQNDNVLHLLMQSIQDVAGGEVAGQIADESHVAGREWVHPPVPVMAGFINSRLGIELPPEDMKKLLENVEFRVELSESRHPEHSEGSRANTDSSAMPQNDNTLLTVAAPFWRTDIETREDVVEEVGRLYGYDKLSQVLPQRDIMPAAEDELVKLKDRVRQALAKCGANELLTYSFVHGDLLQKAGQNPDDAFKVGNALSPDLQYYRLSLTPSLLEKVHPNIKAGYDWFALFEIGKGHNLAHATDDDGLPMEFEMLDLVYASNDTSTQAGAAFYQARRFATSLASEFGVLLEFRPIDKEEDYPVAKPYDHRRSAQIFASGTDIPLGMIGEYKASVRRALKLPAQSAGFGMGLSQLLQALSEAQTHHYAPIPRFPKVTQDITLKAESRVEYSQLYDVVWAEIMKDQSGNILASLGPVAVYQAKDDDAHKNITLRLSIASYQRTMTDAEVASLLDAAAKAAHDKLGAERI
jgi:phenylalanyl-tRNA synthetase beta chain